MDQIYDNRYYSAGSREPSPRRARTVQLGGSAYAGADRSTQRPTSTSRPNAQSNTLADDPGDWHNAVFPSYDIAANRR